MLKRGHTRIKFAPYIRYFFSVCWRDEGLTDTVGGSNEEGVTAAIRNLLMLLKDANCHRTALCKFNATATFCKNWAAAGQELHLAIYVLRLMFYNPAGRSACAVHLQPNQSKWERIWEGTRITQSCSALQPDDQVIFYLPWYLLIPRKINSFCVRRSNVNLRGRWDDRQGGRYVIRQ